MDAVRLRWLLLAMVAGFWLAGSAGAVTILDFETEDDFVTPLINGQIVDPAFDGADLEFGNIVNISSTQLGPNGPGQTHLGASVFDSDPADQLPGTQDPDLLVGTGNILILQNDDSAATSFDATYGLFYDFPNDEKDLVDAGGILFSFLSPIVALSVDIIDANGGFEGKVILTDGGGFTRTYSIPEKWTQEINTCGVCQGYDTLDLTILTPQDGEGTGGDATAVEDVGFDPTDVVTIEVQFLGMEPGGTSSGGLDNLTFIPEPSTALLLGGGLLALGARRRR